MPVLPDSCHRRSRICLLTLGQICCKTIAVQSRLQNLNAWVFVNVSVNVTISVHHCLCPFTGSHDIIMTTAILSAKHSHCTSEDAPLETLKCHSDVSDAQVDPELIAKYDKVSLLEIEMGLVTPDIVWIPELGSSNTSASVRDMFNKWIRSYLEIARLVKRLDIGEGVYRLLSCPLPAAMHT